MPRIELHRPGSPLADLKDVAEQYHITLERGDGKECGDAETLAVLSMFLTEMHRGNLKKSRKKKTT